MACAKCPRAWRPPSPAATMRPRPRTITPRIADRRAPLQEAAVAAFLHGGSHLRHARRMRVSYRRAGRCGAWRHALARRTMKATPRQHKEIADVGPTLDVRSEEHTSELQSPCN